MLRSLALLPLLTLALVAQTPETKPETPAETKPAAEAAAPAPKATAKPKAPAAKAPEKKVDPVLARINGQPVLESEFMLYLDMAYNPQQRMQIGMMEGAMEQVQKQYLQSRLFAAKARKDGMDKTKAFMSKRSMMEMDLLVRSLFDRDGEKLQEKIKVSDEDAKAFFKMNPDKFKTQESFSARHILVSNKDGQGPEAKTLTEDEIKAKVAKVQAALKGGKKFDEAAKEFSEDPGSKDRGGLYEDIAFGAFVPEFEAAVRTQKPGEVGEPVKTQFGYHIIQVEGIKPSALPEFETVKEKAQQMATQARQEQVMNEFVESIKKEIPYQEGGASATPAVKKPKPAKAAKPVAPAATGSN